MTSTEKLEALRTLLNPRVVAAWLDEVESHRRRPEPPEAQRAVTPRPESPVAEPLLSAKDVSERLGLSKQIVYRMVNADELPHIRFGNRIYFVWSQIQQRLADSSRAGATAE